MQDESVFLERMHRRAAEIGQQRMLRRVRLVQAVSAAAGIAAVIVMAVMMPDVLPETERLPVTMQASIFAGNGSLGYIVVGILSFLLGIGITLLCIRLRQYTAGKQEEPHDRDR